MTRLTRPAALPLYTAAASLTLVGALAGCASEMPATPAQPAPDSGSTGAEPTEPGADDGAAPITGDFADGTYTATGSYISPNGTETIDVEVTLTDNVISAVTVGTNPTNPTTSRFQMMFSGGIEAEVVGQRVDEVEVTRVAGSSLTGNGFTDALEQIKADALSN
ncbi:uncharacterized protein with FMN-binding domain [Microcella alkaliphila]|uniref:Uncharacterized protein with FMN-binding domain n=1 Tax=Microcella alkaliphila TaxID=279828 RepID=A0A4V2FMM8_9MICO|nr:hypothetical protein [Microcella alkaliphila]RZT58329.1 uncharacterized protein with FMN-binding domain [Microcella alkaliphila]